MRKLFYSILFCACCFPINAQNAFDPIINTIVENNPEFKSQALQIEAQRLENTDANALANPSVDFSRVWGRHGIGNKLQLDVSQSFEWPGVYGARSRASKMGETVSMANYATSRFALANEARGLLVELIFVRQEIAVTEELIENFKALSEAIDKGVRGGELTVLDQRKMQIEGFEIDNDLSAAVAREQQILSALQSLTTAELDLNDLNEYPIQPLLSRDEYLAMVETDPYVVEQALTAEYETLNANVASKSRMPGFSVGYQHQAEMGDRFNGFTVGVTLPFFQGRKARQAALQRKDAADLSREMAVNKRIAEINGTYNELEIQRRRLMAYKDTFGDQKYLDLLLKAYKGGQISVIEYLSEVHYYHQNMLIYLEAEYNYNLALTTLNCYR